VYDFHYFCVLQKMEIMYKRTNIEIDLDLVQEIMKTYKLKSIKEAVNFSLEKTIDQQKRKKLLAMQGKVQWEGNLDEMRGL
jgi:Arc/MetJ family transcription regulator